MLLMHASAVKLIRIDVAINANLNTCCRSSDLLAASIDQPQRIALAQGTNIDIFAGEYPEHPDISVIRDRWLLLL